MGRIDRFKRRGLAASRSEWRLIAATHNLLKLHRHTLQTAGTWDARQPDPVRGTARRGFRWLYATASAKSEGWTLATQAQEEDASHVEPAGDARIRPRWRFVISSCRPEG
jgi:hypothetical protein